MVSLETAEGTPKYVFLDNVVKDASYALATSDFLDFDHTLTVSFPNALFLYCNLSAYDPAKYAFRTGYALYNSSISRSDRTSIKLGYLDQFKKYAISMGIKSDEISYGFTSIGDMPKNVNFPTGENYKLKDNSVNGFSLAGNPTYTYRQSTYFMNDATDPLRYAAWHIYSPASGFKMPSFPKELTDVYSFLNVDGFEHSSTMFVKGYSYDRQIDFSFKGAARGEYEMYTVSVAE